MSHFLPPLLLAIHLVAINSIAVNNQVLIISLDGFRFDYYDTHKSRLSSLTQIASSGVHAINGIQSVFATKTFPAHWSIATGLYEDSHGLISNSFFDPVLNKTFSKKSLDRVWYQGEPIWVTAQKSNKKVGTFFWVGSEVDWTSTDGHDWNPSHRMRPYNTSIPLRTRVEKVVQWLADDELDLVMMYWHQPDAAGHNYGPSSSSIGQQLDVINENLEFLMAELKNRKKLDNLNIIVLGDHGMIEINQKNGSVFLDDYINCARDLIAVDEGPVSAIWPRNGTSNQVLERLKRIPNNLADVYNRSEIPDRLHYKNHYRIPPILIVAKSGYVIQKNNASRFPGRGNHGYDNNLADMRPLFFARGPQFKSNYKFETTFELVNIYELVCNLLKIKPAANNGSLDSVRHLLRNPKNSTTRATFNCVLSLISMSIVFLFAVY